MTTDMSILQERSSQILFVDIKKGHQQEMVPRVA